MLDTVRKRKPDREARVILRYLELPMSLSVKTFSLEQLRTYWDRAAKLMGTCEPVEKVEDRRVAGPCGSIGVRIYTPFSGKSPRPGMLWIHGGSFIAGSLNSADSICRVIAGHCGTTVVSVDYRLAPEHDLYAGREDCLSVIRWLARHGDEIGIDPHRLAVGGDSAGGNLAAALAKKCKDSSEPTLRLQVLVYPLTDFVGDYPSRHEGGRGCFLTKDILDWVTNLIREKADFDDPWISPMQASDLESVAPGLVVTAGFDPLRDEGVAYAKRLRAAGVPVEHIHYAGQFHGFLNFDTALLGARDALKRIGTALSRVMSSRKESPGFRDRTLEIADSSASYGKAADLIHEGAAGSLMFWDWLGQGGRKLAHFSLPSRWIPRIGKSRFVNPVEQLERLRDLVSKQKIHVTMEEDKDMHEESTK